MAALAEDRDKVVEAFERAECTAEARRPHTLAIVDRKGNKADLFLWLDVGRGWANTRGRPRR